MLRIYDLRFFGVDAKECCIKLVDVFQYASRRNTRLTTGLRFSRKDCVFQLFRFKARDTIYLVCQILPKLLNVLRARKAA